MTGQSVCIGFIERDEYVATLPPTVASDPISLALPLALRITRREPEQQHDLDHVATTERSTRVAVQCTYLDRSRQSRKFDPPFVAGQSDSDVEAQRPRLTTDQYFTTSQHGRLATGQRDLVDATQHPRLTTSQHLTHPVRRTSVDRCGRTCRTASVAHNRVDDRFATLDEPSTPTAASLQSRSW